METATNSQPPKNEINKRIFANISHSVVDGYRNRVSQGVLDYLKVRHPEHNFGIQDNGDIWVKSELSDNEATALLKDVALTGVNTYRSLNKYAD